MRTSISSEGYESRNSVSSFSLSAPASRTSSVGSYDTNEKWIGELLPQMYVNPQFSKRIFLGSNDSIDVDGVRAFLEAFGPCEFPIHGHEKFGRHVYCRFEDPRSVRALVMHCDMHREQIYLPFPERNVSPLFPGSFDVVVSVENRPSYPIRHWRQSLPSPRS